MEILVRLQYYQAKVTTLRSNHYLRAFRPWNIFYVDFSVFNFIIFSIYCYLYY